MDTLERLQRRVADEIPLARAAGIRLALDADGSLRAEAPFDANGNLHGTVFGGSLYVVALVAGFAQTQWLVTSTGLDAAVVVQRAETRYLAPLRRALTTRMDLPEAAVLARFVDAVAHRGRGRLALTVRIADDDGDTAFEFDGTFVATAAPGARNPRAESRS